jgi:5-methylcytosine-specific restriction endonuclease McrA
MSTNNNVVYVIDVDGKPLLPTTPARGRLLLKKGRATLVSVVPFTIKLKRRVDNPVGEFTVAIDDGAKYVGVAVVNEHKNEVVFSGTIRLRQDVSRKMKQRAQYRKTRRSRNLRYRKTRFKNRKPYTPFPSIKFRKDTIMRVLFDINKRLNITRCIIEQGQFNISSILRGVKLHGKEYQQSEFEGHNRRAKVLWRDKYECRHCKSKNELQVHHIIHRSKGGTNTMKNLITLCKTCHENIHRGKLRINYKPPTFKYPQHLMQGKWYLFNMLKSVYSKVNVCFGWMTSKWRNELRLEKTHYNDAVSMICRASPTFRCVNYTILPKRRKIWDDNPTKTCDEKNGFRHYDLVKSHNRTRGIVIGSIRSLKKNNIALRTNFNNNFLVSYKKTKLLYRFKNLIYT